MKTCKGCNQVLPVDQFSKRAGSKDGLRYKCRACVSAGAMAWYKNHKDDASIKERKSEYDKSRYAGHESDEGYLIKRAATNKAWYENNKVRKLAANREWAANNLNKRAIHSQRRRALKLSATIEELPNDYWNQLLNLYGSQCMYPGCMEIKLTLDHVIPLTKGGRHSMDNFQLLCRSHNSSKGTKTIDYGGNFNDREMD